MLKRHKGLHAFLGGGLAGFSRVGVLLLGLMWAGSGFAQTQMPVPPQLSAAGRDDFLVYLSAERHKAFAIAPGGAWAWVSSEGSAEAAATQALARCAEHTEQRCQTYVVNDRRVLDDKRWASALRLENNAVSTLAGTGLRRGALFPDVQFSDPFGRAGSVAQFRGKPVVLHFWGSWCGPCRRELPDMAALAKALVPKGVVFVPLQVREAHAVSKQWIAQQGISLPLFDSGVWGDADGGFAIRGGGQLPDRAVAPVFPSTVVLDRLGRVVLKHHGPIERWEDYRAMLLALAR